VVTHSESLDNPHLRRIFWFLGTDVTGLKKKYDLTGSSGTFLREPTRHLHVKEVFAGGCNLF